MSAPTSSALQALGNGLLLALCCKCNNQRTCKRPKNYVYDECETWTRQTGDLKCSVCQRVTRHAIVRGNDFDEQRQLEALGFTDRFSEAQARRIQDAYRQGLPRNPFLDHRFWVADHKKALEHNNSRMRTLCGELVDTPQTLASSTAQSGSDDVEPDLADDPYREYDDPNTGLWWRATECVNCLRVSNARKLERQREQLKALMTTALVELINDTKAKLYDPHVESLIEALDRVHQRNT